MYYAAKTKTKHSKNTAKINQAISFVHPIERVSIPIGTQKAAYPMRIFKHIFW